MIQISQIKLPVSHTKKDLDNKIKKLLGLKEVPEYRIKKQSIDARKKPDIKYIYTVELSMAQEQKLIKRCRQASMIQE